MNDAIKLDVKGVILCPACNNTAAFVYPDAKGRASSQCKRCERFLLIDYDKMVAIIIPAIGRKCLRICKRQIEP